MSSQRHRQIVRNYGAACTPIAEKQPAAGYLLQVPGPYTVRTGPPGGPLQGSSLMGPPPAAIPAPGLAFDHPLLALGIALGGSQVPPDQPSDQTPDPQQSGRDFPIGPVTLAKLEDHADGIQLTPAEPIDIHVGDTVNIEATGSTPMNGSYVVLSINPIVVDNTTALAAPIDGKGRVTVLGGS